jgi:type I restriction enzyme S subunit
VNWQFKKLGEVLRIQNGYAFDSKKFSPDGDMQLIRIRDIKKGIDTETSYSGEYDLKYVVKKGDLLIGMDGEFGCYEWKGKDSLLNQRVCRLQDFDDLIHPRFLFYGINSYLKEIESVTNFITVKHLSSKQIANIDFPLPSFTTQQKIVAKLDAILAEIDKAVLATEANVKNFEALWQSTIDRVINDFSHLNTPTSFDEIVSIKSKLIDPKEEKFHNFIHIGAANIVSNSDELCELKTAKDEGLISGKFIFDENTILYSKIRPYLKKVAKPSFIGLCSADVYPLVCNEKMMIKDFLFYILLSSDFTKFAISGSDRAGMPKVNRDHLFSYKINLPSISAQMKLTEQINQIKDEVKSSLLMLSKKLDELNLLKKSILRQAFNGELVKD